MRTVGAIGARGAMGAMGATGAIDVVTRTAFAFCILNLALLPRRYNPPRRFLWLDDLRG